MRFCGYGQADGARAGVTEDIANLIATYAPNWIVPGVTLIDVPEGQEGVDQLVSITATLSPSSRVLLSYRAQAALMKIMAREQEIINEMILLANSMPPQNAAAVLGTLMRYQGDLSSRFSILQRANVQALQAGVPSVEQALGSEEAARTISGGEIAVLAAAVVIAIAVIVTVGVVITKAISGVSSKLAELTAFRQMVNAGQYDQAAGMFAQMAEPSKKFPWMWVIGIGATAIGGTLLLAWYQGYFEEAGKRLTSRRAA